MRLRSESRLTATSGNVNGGFFDPVIAGVNGGDYSQQDVAVSSSTAWASTIGTTDPSLVTLSGFTPSLALIGNAMHCTAGTSWNTAAATAYHIIIGTGTNGVYIHGAAGSAATLSGGTCYIGGAASLGAGSDVYYFRAALGTNGVGGTKIWWKQGSYTMGAALSTLATCGTQAPCIIGGYQTTRGDQPSMDNAPYVNAGNLLQHAVGQNWELKYITLVGNGNIMMLMTGTNTRLIKCRIINNAHSNKTAISAGVNSLIYGCDICAYSGTAIGWSNITAVRIIGNYIHDSLYGIGISLAQAGHTIIGNLFVGNQTHDFDATNAWTTMILFAENTFYGNESQIGDSINFITGTYSTLIYDNIFYGKTTAVSIADAVNNFYSDYNDYYNNGSDGSNLTKGTHDLAVNPMFANVHQLTNQGTVTTGASNFTLTDTGQDFSTVVSSQDYIDILSGTNVTAGTYKVVGVAPGGDTTKIVLDLNPTTSGTGSSITYGLTTGRNFIVGPFLRRMAFPQMFASSATLNYSDIGATQHHDAPRAYAQ